MTLVIDASVATKWLLPEPDADRAELLKAEDLIAPPMFRLECGNAIIKRLRIGELSAANAKSRLEEVTRLPVSLRPVNERDVLELALLLHHPVYDCAYLSLAHALGLRLVTADRRMRDAVAASSGAAQLLPIVTLLTDYP